MYHLCILTQTTTMFDWHGKMSLMESEDKRSFQRREYTYTIHTKLFYHYTLQKSITQGLAVVTQAYFDFGIYSQRTLLLYYGIQQTLKNNLLKNRYIYGYNTHVQSIPSYNTWMKNATQSSIYWGSIYQVLLLITLGITFNNSQEPKIRNKLKLLVYNFNI